MAAVTTIGVPSKYAFWSWPEPCRVPAARCTFTNAGFRDALAYPSAAESTSDSARSRIGCTPGTVRSALKNPASALPVLVKA